MEQLTKKEQVWLKTIKEFLANGRKLTVRSLQETLEYASPRSISLLIENLTRKWWIYRDLMGKIQISPNHETDSASVRNIPLIGSIACGIPIFAEENVETLIPVSEKITKSNVEYFFLRADGDSMNKKDIFDGDLVLIEQTHVAQNGDIVVALINDSATLKEFQTRGNAVFLIPHSTNPEHSPIILDAAADQFSIQGRFVQSFPGSLFA